MQSLWPSYFIGRPILNSNVHAREPKETSQLPGQGRCPSGPLQPKVRVGWEELGRDICTKGYSQKIYLKTRPQLPGPHLGGRLRCVWLTGVPEARPYGGPFTRGQMLIRLDGRLTRSGAQAFQGHVTGAAHWACPVCARAVTGRWSEPVWARPAGAPAAASKRKIQGTAKQLQVQLVLCWWGQSADQPQCHVVYVLRLQNTITSFSYQF